MEIRPDIAISAVLKSLRDVVLPALDPNDKMAAEQSHLIVGLLSLVADRLPLQFQYDMDELARSVSLARSLRPHADETLNDAIVRGERLLETAVNPSEIITAGAALKAATGAVIGRAYAAADADARVELTATVLGTAEVQHLHERAWLIAQGWETDPASVPPIEELLAR